MVIGVGALLCSVALLRDFDRNTEAVLTQTAAANKKTMAGLEARTKVEMAKLENEIRKITKGMGFNIYIFPKDQELSEVYAEGFASKTMPEEYVNTLAKSKAITVNHLLPSLTQKVKWPEQKRTVLLIGVRGEVPFTHKTQKKPLIDPVPEGKAVLGHELHQSLSLTPGDTLELLGRKFTVHRCHDERGTIDDITIWISLKEAQELLDKQGRINAILALECNCATVDRLSEIRQEIATILPDTQVIEKGSQALARAEARKLAKATAEKQMEETRAAGREQLEIVKQERGDLRGKYEAFAAILVPLVLLVCVLWVGFLTFLNVRERTAEIGILRAIGIGPKSVLTIFLAKAFLTGVSGALIGCLLVFVLGANIIGASSADGLNALFRPAEIVLVLVLSPLLACAAAWLPALLASSQDPAAILREG